MKTKTSWRVTIIVDTGQILNTRVAKVMVPENQLHSGDYELRACHAVVDAESYWSEEHAKNLAVQRWEEVLRLRELELARAEFAKVAK